MIHIANGDANGRLVGELHVVKKEGIENSLLSLKTCGVPAPPKLELLAGPMVIHTMLMCRLTCNLCWALDTDLYSLSHA